MEFSEHHECVIVGGGPAGATAGTILAQHGRRPLVLERSAFPRHHIGESLMPQTYWTFQRLGMLEKLQASDFPRKESVQFVPPTGQDSQPYYFTDRDPGAWSTTWQVCRDRFDKMMLDNAREHGAIVREGVRVSRVLMDGTRAIGVETVTNGGTERIGAKVVIDATGTTGMLSKALDLREPEPELKNASIYAYYKGAKRDAGRNNGATIIIHTPGREGWFWLIPLSDDVTSIGLVAPPAYLFAGRGDDPGSTLAEEIARTPGIAGRLENATRTSQVFVTSDFSYRSREVAGDGWLLVGDAFGFLDPVYSSGVFLALISGEWAGDAVHDALSTGDLSARTLGAWSPKFLTGMHLMRKLVYAFYDPKFSFGQFAKVHPEHQDHIVRLLIGDVFNDEVAQVFETMGAWMARPDTASIMRSGT